MNVATLISDYPANDWRTEQRTALLSLLLKIVPKPFNYKLTQLLPLGRHVFDLLLFAHQIADRVERALEVI